MKTRIKIVERNNGRMVYIAQVYRHKYALQSIFSFPCRLIISVLYFLLGWADTPSWRYGRWLRLPFWRNIVKEYSHPHGMEFETKEDEEKHKINSAYFECYRKECTAHGSIDSAKIEIQQYIDALDKKRLQVVQEKQNKKKALWADKIKSITFVKHP